MTFEGFLGTPATRFSCTRRGFGQKDPPAQNGPERGRADCEPGAQEARPPPENENHRGGHQRREQNHPSGMSGSPILELEAVQVLDVDGLFRAEKRDDDGQPHRDPAAATVMMKNTRVCAL